jgi:hypothetical protein
MIELTYTQLFVVLALAFSGGGFATVLLASVAGRMGDPDDPQLNTESVNDRAS